IIHRAELIMEQVYDISDSLFTAPSGLFLDAYDPSVSKYRTIPYDFQIDYTSTPNFASLGVYNFWKKDLFGNTIREWRFNLSRYVQNVVNDSEPVYDLRVHSPYSVVDLYRVGRVGNPSSNYNLSVNSTAAKGRVR